MGHLKNKSDINLFAAELLHKQNLYPSVVHCAYYCCIQFMKHIWLTEMNKSEEDLKQLNQNSNEGSHEILINEIKKHLTNQNLDSRVFYKDILQLKRLRINADYFDLQIDYTISDNSISLSKSVLKNLKNDKK
jgi:hypothetical protein